MPPIVAVTNNLFLGGSTTLLLNFLRVLQGAPDRLHVVSFGDVNEHAADFAALPAEVWKAQLGRLIYEDRLLWAYQQVARLQPRAVLACLGAESYEILRLAPAGVARIGLAQADNPLVYEMTSRYHASLDAMVAVSQEIAERLRRRPELRGVRVVEIPYGIAFASAEPRPARREGEPLRLLYVGRLIEEQKRISRIVELIQGLEARGAPVRFTIAGAGPEEAAVRRALSGSRMAQLRGAIPNHEVTALLRAHDVFVLLSDYEGLPLSLLEAMGEGVVPVVSDLPSGIGQAVAPGTGIRVPIGDVRAATEEIISLAGDRERLFSLSHAAAAHARAKFSAARMVAQYQELIDSIVPDAFEPRWPAEIAIPAPHGLTPWLYSGFGRVLRRQVKRLRRASAPAPSSPA
jgi:glycosyltransferase involved in cell wall biosynthesis